MKTRPPLAKLALAFHGFLFLPQHEDSFGSAELVILLYCDSACGRAMIPAFHKGAPGAPNLYTLMIR
jgi:hypothetical protein